MLEGKEVALKKLNKEKLRWRVTHDRIAKVIAMEVDSNMLRWPKNSDRVKVQT